MLLLILLGAQLGLLVLAGASCIAGPIALPIANTSFSTFGSNRGVRIGVGTPAQYLALDASFEYNNTLVWPASSGCPTNTYYPACIAARGGSFQSQGSSTYNAVANVAVAGGSLIEHELALLPNYTSWATDSIHVDSDTTVAAMPYGMLQPPADQLVNVQSGGALYDGAALLYGYSRLASGFQGVIGLGSNSSILNTLTASGQLGSHVWSYFYGLTGATEDEQTDGTLVLGGYDAAKIQGPNVTFPLSVNTTDPDDEISHSGLLCRPNQPFVTITNVTITQTLADGQLNTTNLFKSAQQSIRACIDLHFEGTMLLPEPLWSDFAAMTGIQAYNKSIDRVTSELAWMETLKGFNGSMSVSLGDGVDIRLDNNVLVQPTRYFDNNGDLIANTSRPKTYVVQQPYYQPLGLLGRNFFSSAYIMFNPKKEEMTVWQANATNRQQQLVPVSDDGQVTQSCPRPVGETAAGGGAAGTNKTLSGAVVAAALSSIAGVALVCTSVICLWWRRRRDQARKRSSVSLTGKRPPSTASELSGISCPSELTEKYLEPELAGQPRSELHDDCKQLPQQVHELPASYEWVTEMETKV